MQLFRGLIAAAVRNPVAVNLLMVCALVGGVLSTRGMVREGFPEFSLDHIAVEVAYPGAGTSDVERAICTPIEEALQGLSGVLEISSSAQANFGIVWVALLGNVEDPQVVLDEIKDRVDQITTFPVEAHKPIVYETVIRGAVIDVAIYGDVPERTLKRFAQQVSDDLSVMPEVSQIELSGARKDEIVIEVSREALQAYNLSLPEVMSVVAKSSLDLPAGVIRTASEEFTLRIAGQRYTAFDYADLVLVNHQDAVVRLSDVATVREGFEEAVVRGRFNGRPAVLVRVFKTPTEDTTDIAARVREYVAARQARLPDGLRMSVWADQSIDVDSRIEMLVENGALGILLVFITLAMFLELRLAFWVAMGIPVSFAAALIIINGYGQTLNMISLFALIMVSGIIVDDAIVIAESVHSRRRAGDPPALAVVEGTSRVALPVLGASITTIVAFVPLLYVVGVMGRLIYVLPVVVIAGIAASSVEAFFILPSHLNHAAHHSGSAEPNRLRRATDRLIEHAITRWYRPAFRRAMSARPVMLAIAIALFLVAVGVAASGRTPFVLLPQEDGNILRARVRFPEGTPLSVTEHTVDRLTESAWALNDDEVLAPAEEGSLVRQVYSTTGEFADFLAFRGNNLCEVRVELMPAERRRLSDDIIIEQWRKNLGTIDGATQVRLSRQPLGPLETPIEIRLLGDDLDDLTAASLRIQDKLRGYDGLFNIGDDLIPGKRELLVRLKPAARAAGLTLEDVARQLRYGFFGGEAVELQRGREQVIVRVRYPDDERQSIADLERVRIRTPRGVQMLFYEVADVTWGRGYSYVMHQDNNRRVRVVADVDPRLANAEQIVGELQAGFLDEVVADYNDMTYAVAGNRAQIVQSLDSLFAGFAMAIVAMYSILAAMLRSYVQPLVIMMAIPFGLVGVIFGHAVLGMDLTLMSLFGTVALSGVVVNDSLVLLDAINHGVREGKGVVAAVLDAGELRFRAVTLTTITTVAGLVPILLERSSQAHSVQPMAVALCFGLTFATVLTLFIVPACYLLVNDARRFVRWLVRGGSYPVAESVEEAANETLAGTFPIDVNTRHADTSY